MGEKFAALFVAISLALFAYSTILGWRRFSANGMSITMAGRTQMRSPGTMKFVR